MVKKRKTSIPPRVLVKLITTLLQSSFLIPSTQKPGNVIILDGTSCAGKSSIVRELTPLLDESYKFVGLDAYVTKLFMDRQYTKLSFTEFRKKYDDLTYQMYADIRAIVRNGTNVICDTILTGLLGNKQVQQGIELLDDLKVDIILIYCPLPEIVKRIELRNQKALVQNRPWNIRPIILTLKFTDMYQTQQTDAAHFVDTLSRAEIEKAFEQKQDDCPEKIEVYQKIKATLLNSLDLLKKESIHLWPRLIYDCIVYSNRWSPKKCAKSIYCSVISSDGSVFKKLCSSRFGVN